MLGGFNNFKGKKVVITVAMGYSSGVDTVSGVVKAQLAVGENDILLYLDNGIIVNSRFIVEIEVKD